MRAAVLTGILEIEIKELPIPEPRSGEVLIRVRAAGICGAELHAYMGTHPLRKPRVLMGHETAGDVVDIGKDVHRFAKGDRVTVFPLKHCGACNKCNEGMYNLCENHAEYRIKNERSGLAPRTSSNFFLDSARTPSRHVASDVV